MYSINIKGANILENNENENPAEADVPVQPSGGQPVKSGMSDGKKAILFTYLPAIIFYVLDQVSKQMVINAMPIPVDLEHKTYGYFPPNRFSSIMWIYHVKNFGSAWSMFYGHTSFLAAFAGLVCIGLIVYERKTYKGRHPLLSLCFGMIFAGAMGNLTDRVRIGCVTDFFDTVWNGKNIWPVFNVADISIDVAVGLLVIYFIFLEKKVESPDKKADTGNTVNHKMV